MNETPRRFQSAGRFVWPGRRASLVATSVRLKPARLQTAALPGHERESPVGLGAVDGFVKWDFPPHIAGGLRQLQRHGGDHRADPVRLRRERDEGAGEAIAL